MGDYKTTNTTSGLDQLVGIHTAKVEDRNGNVGRGAGWTQEEAERSAFGHLKDADPSDSRYEPAHSSGSSDGSSRSSSGSSRAESSNKSNHTSENSRSYSSSGSDWGGGGYSGGGGSVDVPTTNILRGLAGVISALFIGGVVYWGIFGKNFSTNSKHPNYGVITVEDYQRMSPEEKSKMTRKFYHQVRQNLEERAKWLARDLEKGRQLEGDFNDYQLVIPPETSLAFSSDEVAFISSHNLYTFRSSHRGPGSTWEQVYPDNLFLRKLCREYEIQVERKKGISQAWLNGLKSRGEDPYYLPKIR